MHPNNSPLGKRSAYIDHYMPDLLFPILRKTKRDEIGVTNPLPFFGYDVWNAYEVSWLNANGKPIVAMAEIIFPASSDFLIESKSLKLYLNSFNQTQFENEAIVANHLVADLSQATLSTVAVKLITHNQIESLGHLNGDCIDHLDIAVDIYQPQPELLKTENHSVTETVHSHLLKSNCLVTAQPDWGSIEIAYTGKKILAESLLKYIVSFRNHNEFHEQCIERIFMDIMARCQPIELTVYGRYTRRGGLDINPYRSTNADYPIRNTRLARQ